MQGVRHTPESFWAMAERDGPCLVWRHGLRSKTGRYGAVTYHGVRWTAHRLAWVLARGPIPAGLVVCHTCDRKMCIEPLHLFLGTNEDNTRDHVLKGRSWMNGRSGQDNPAAKVTPTQVSEIRALAAQGISRRTIGRTFGLSHQHVTKIVNRQRWADLP